MKKQLQSKNYTESLREYAEQLCGIDSSDSWSHSPLNSYLGMLLEEVSTLPSPQKEQTFVEKVLGNPAQDSARIRQAA